MSNVEVFSFGDPEPVLDKREILGYLESPFLDKYYSPPISLEGLAKSFLSNAHHASALYVKRNIMVGMFKPNPYLSRKDFKRAVLEYLIFGNAYFIKNKSLTGKTLSIDVAPSKYMRVGQGSFWYLNGLSDTEIKGKVAHILEPDINQEIYGIPEYLAALSSALLNESATLFRRKYFKNGSHAGYILYVTDSQIPTDDVEEMKRQLRNSQGPGNFKNLFVNSPNGSKDGIQLIPVSEVSAKDEFLNIKNVTRDDVLAAHRVPPQLMGIIPNNTGGFGDVEKAASVFYRNELIPLQNTFLEVNEIFSEKIIEFGVFEPYTTTNTP
jgi:PBSX family phage portal protein